jgi:hypothetical protein
MLFLLVNGAKRTLAQPQRKLVLSAKPPSVGEIGSNNIRNRSEWLEIAQ